MPMIRVYVETGFAGGTHEDWYELPDGWEDMTEQEQKKELDEMAQDYLNNYVECGAHVVEKEGDR